MKKTNAALEKIFSAKVGTTDLITYLPLSAQEDIFKSFRAITGSNEHKEFSIANYDRFIDLVANQALIVERVAEVKLGATNPWQAVQENAILSYLTEQKFIDYYTKSNGKLVALNQKGRLALRQLVEKVYDMLCNCFAKQEQLEF